jgi:hypothetical protein
MTDPFASPGSPSGGITWADHKGALLLVSPLKVEDAVPTSYGDKEAIRADVVVLDGARAGEEHPDALIFPGVLISQLRRNVGKRVIGRLGQGRAKSGQQPPWLLEEATDADKQIGVKYLAGGLAAASAPPF